MAWKQGSQQTSRNKNKSILFAFVLMTAIFLIFAPTLASVVSASPKIPKVKHSVILLNLSKPSDNTVGFQDFNIFKGRLADERAVGIKASIRVESYVFNRVLFEKLIFKKIETC